MRELVALDEHVLPERLERVQLAGVFASELLDQQHLAEGAFAENLRAAWAVSDGGEIGFRRLSMVDLSATRSARTSGIRRRALAGGLPGVPFLLKVVSAAPD